MTFKLLVVQSVLPILLATVMSASGPARAASTPVEAAIRTLATLPSDAIKFAAYCNLLGEMERVPDNNAAKYETLEDLLDGVIESYGPEVLKAWSVLSEVDPDTDDGKAVAAAFESIEEKCP